MIKYPITIKPFGTHAVVMEWPNQVDEAILDDILLFLAHFKKDINALDTAGYEWVPAYNSLTIIQKNENINFTELQEKLHRWYAETDKVELPQKFLWKLPVCYDLDFGDDLKEVAAQLQLSVAEVIKLHTSLAYTVYGIGFLPGFMYLGGLPKTLEIPRRASPRLNVRKGSVGLAGKQTGIYPQDSPGGWNIIGNCPIPMFHAGLEHPCFVSVGDKVQFYEISRAEYDLHKIESEVGIYTIEKSKIDA